MFGQTGAMLNLPQVVAVFIKLKAEINKKLIMLKKKITKFAPQSW